MEKWRNGEMEKWSAGKHSSTTSLMGHNSTSFEQSLLNYSYARATKAPETGYTSLPESSQANEDEKDEQAPLHSLPSIREILDRNSPLPYSMPGSLPRLQLAHTASYQITRPNVGYMPTPPNNFSRPLACLAIWDYGFPHLSQQRVEMSRTNLTSITTQESENVSLDSLSVTKSPIQSAKTDVTSVSESLHPSEFDDVYPCAPVTAQTVNSTRRIPRLHKTVSLSKRRVSVACGPCHLTKARCSGESPECQRCRTSQKKCWYRQRNQENTQKKLEQLSSQVQDYKDVLQQIHSRANSEDAKLISNVLSKVRRNQHPTDETQIDS